MQFTKIESLANKLKKVESDRLALDEDWIKNRIPRTLHSHWAFVFRDRRRQLIELIKAELERVLSLE